MNKPWNYYGEVKVCRTCDGAGLIPSFRRATVDDPYPESPCPDCDGEPHEPECEVCGFHLPIAGYDCFVCDTVSGLYAADAKAILRDFDQFTSALRVALELDAAEERAAA